MTTTQQAVAQMCTTLVVAVVVRLFLWPWIPRVAVTPLAIGLGLAVATLVFPYLNKRSVSYSLFLGLTVAGTLAILNLNIFTVR